MSWNVNGTFPPQGSPDTITEQIDWLSSLDDQPDILLLQEVNQNRRESWREQLADVGYQSMNDTLDWAAELENSNGHLTAVRGPWDLSENKFGYDEEEKLDPELLGTSFPEKILITDIEHPQGGIEVCNVRAVPGNNWGVEKIQILEIVYEWLTESEEKPRVLAGDLNSPDYELADGQAVPFGYDKDPEIQKRWVSAELNILKGLGHLGMVDTFRATHGYGSLEQLDASWDHQKRFDHLFASESLSISDCRYLAEGYEYSDHAPIVGKFEI